MMMDLATCDWHQPFLPLFNMKRNALPRIVSNAEAYGTVAAGPLTGEDDPLVKPTPTQ